MPKLKNYILCALNKYCIAFDVPKGFTEEQEARLRQWMREYYDDVVAMMKEER